MRNLFFVLFLLFSYAFAMEPDERERRIEAHLLLEDASQAVLESKAYCKEHPDILFAHKLLIKSYALQRNEEALLEAWKDLKNKFPEQGYEREILEEVSWGILLNSPSYQGLSPRLISLLAAAFTQQVQAVQVLKEGLHHSNAHIRAMAVNFASLYGDQSLREEICRLYYSEKSREVQKEIHQAISKLHLLSFLPDLMEKLTNQRSSWDEKREIIETIASLRDKVGRPELEHLAFNRRSALRILAAECIAICQQKEDQDLLFLLLQDSQQDVKIAALKALGILRAENLPAELYACASSTQAPLSLTACWVLLLAQDAKAESLIEKWLNSSQLEEQRLAAGVLLASGSYGIPLAKKWVSQHEDPFVRVNLAILLARQRQESSQACVQIELFLKENSGQLMWKKDLFERILPSEILHDPLIVNMPEVVSQNVRLELINILCILEHPGCLDVIKHFLKETTWAVTSLAAELLLGEGDESAIESVKSLLNDPDRHVRTEAAFILATWGQDSSAIPLLKDLYKNGDKELKIRVLESLGRLGDAETVPFFVECLQDPSHSMRMVAACMLILTLNH